MITGMHHFGMMVDNLDEAADFYTSLGFRVFKQFSDPGYKAAMLYKDKAGLELWEFDNPSSTDAMMIKKHSAFSSDNIEQDLKTFLSNDYELAIPLTETSGDIVKRYAYLKDKAGNYIELCEPN